MVSVLTLGMANVLDALLVSAISIEELGAESLQLSSLHYRRCADLNKICKNNSRSSAITSTNLAHPPKQPIRAVFDISLEVRMGK